MKVFATVADGVPATVVLAVPARFRVPVHIEVPEPGAVVPVHFSRSSVPDEEAVPWASSIEMSWYGRWATKTLRSTAVAASRR